MSFSKFFVYGLVILGLALPHAPQAQAQEYYKRQTGLYPRQFELSVVLQDLGVISAPNRVIGAADDLFKGGIVTLGVWVLTRALGSVGLLPQYLKAVPDGPTRVAALGTSAGILVGISAGLVVIGIAVDKFSGRRPTYVSDASDYYTASPENFAEFLALPTRDQLAAVEEGYNNGKPQLGEYVSLLANAIRAQQAAM